MGRLARFIHFYTDEDDGADVGPTNIVSGNPPLSLANALAKKIRRLTQYGKCTVSGTDITCNNGVLKYDSELGIYADGTPEEIRVTANGADDQTATVSNLFAVGNIADEQDIISGTITRRCEAVVSDGSTPSGRYIGMVGEGNIIVQTKETGYSGAIASFTADKAEPLSGLVAQINPVQDLNGQDAPYPAGGGKNKFPYATIEGQGNILLKQPAPISAGSYIVSCVRNTNTGYFSLVFYDASDNQVGSTTLYLNNTNAVALTLSADATKVTCYAPQQMSVSNVQIEVGSSATSYQPYSNICPISGWTGVSGWRRGGNVIDWTYGQSQTSSGITSSGVVDDCKAVFNGTATSTIGFTLGRKAVKNGETYTITVKGVDSTHTINCRAIKGDLVSGGEYISMVKNFNSDGSYTFTCDGTYNIVDFRPTFQSGAVCNNYEMFFAITGGTNPASFEPVNSEAISVSFGRTVYGGTVDVVSGLLTVDRVSVEYDGSSDERWMYSSGWSSGANTNAFYIEDALPNALFSSLDEVFCTSNLLPAVSRNVLSVNDVPSIGYSGITYPYLTVRVFKSSASTAEEFKTWLQSNHLQVVYMLAQHQTYQLTPQEVDTLVGQNNVWVDTGDVSAYIPNFTTEQVAGQSLSTTEGTNTVFVTSNVDPVELEVEYRTP